MLSASFADSPLYSWLGGKGYCVRLSEHADGVLPGGSSWVLQPAPVGIPRLAELDDVYCTSPAETWCAAYFWMIQLISGTAGGDIDRGVLSPGEQATFTILVILSALLWSQIIGSFCDVITNMRPEETAFHQRMDSLNRYCRLNGFDTPTRRRLREFLLRTRAVQAADSQRDLLNVMSPKIRGEIALQVSGPWLTRIPFLKAVEIECMANIALSLQSAIFAPSEVLASDSLYFVSRGTAVVSGLVKVGGSVFGDDCVLANPGLRSAPARCLTYTDVSYVQREDLLAVIQSSRAGTDRQGNPVEVNAYPEAIVRLRWHCIRVALVRFIRKSAEQENQSFDGLRRSGWASAFLKLAAPTYSAEEGALAPSAADEGGTPQAAGDASERTGSEASTGCKRSLLKRASTSARSLVARAGSQEGRPSVALSEASEGVNGAAGRATHPVGTCNSRSTDEREMRGAPPLSGAASSGRETRTIRQSAPPSAQLTGTAAAGRLVDDSSKTDALATVMRL